MSGWALDLGTTNSALARWRDAEGRPELVELPRLTRRPAVESALQPPQIVPSAVDLLTPRGFLDRLLRWPPVQRAALLGRQALVGREALDHNAGNPRPSFVPTFKPALAEAPLRIVARLGREPITARQAARAYLRELLRELARETGARPRELVVTSPVMAFETYRAEVHDILRHLGVRRVRFLDEPVAAALGYGLSLSRNRNVLVVDIGGGTMHVVLVRLSAREALDGVCTVLGKRGNALAGNAVDGWVLEELCRRMGHDLSREDDDELTQLWRRLMLAEACRVKEAVFFADQATFLMTPPARGHAIPRPPSAESATLSRSDLIELLEKNGFYASLAGAVGEVLAQAKVGRQGVDEVLLVGGSTLLPGVFAFLEERFGRSALHPWQPFEAVALGAACFASGRVATQDFIVHDYAFVTHDARTGEERQVVIVPRGTVFPTAADLWKQELVPTCALGQPETVFKLLICEIASGEPGGRRFVWDAAGDLHKVGGGDGAARIVVPLNAAHPTLGTLDPPHSPRDRRPRLEVAFGVTADRWLIATVRDLLTARELMHQEPVVRLV